MIEKAFYTIRPEAVRRMPLPTGETDIWLRKNIEEVQDAESKTALYRADEAYMRTADTEGDFEQLFERAAAWQPVMAEPEPDTPGEQIEADYMRLAKDLTDVQLALCELYEMIGGGK